MAIAHKISESESTLTSRYQTTIPQMVRKILGLDKNDKIKYTLNQDGSVLLSKLENEDEDPVLGQFLAFLTNDISENPYNLQAMDSDLVQKAQSLVADVEIDLNNSLSDEDE